MKWEHPSSLSTPAIDKPRHEPATLRDGKLCVKCSPCSKFNNYPASGGPGEVSDHFGEQIMQQPDQRHLHALQSLSGVGKLILRGEKSVNEN